MTTDNFHNQVRKMLNERYGEDVDDDEAINALGRTLDTIVNYARNLQELQSDLRHVVDHMNDDYQEIADPVINVIEKFVSMTKGIRRLKRGFDQEYGDRRI